MTFDEPSPTAHDGRIEVCGPHYSNLSDDMNLQYIMPTAA